MKKYTIYITNKSGRKINEKQVHAKTLQNAMISYAIRYCNSNQFLYLKKDSYKIVGEE